MDLKNGNCLELMKKIPDKSVDLFICDLPYVDISGKGETNCKWNQSAIDMEEFWKEFRRIRKSKRVACIHFCSTKFGYSLIKSWEKGFKMDMVWKKRNKTGGLQSRSRPMRNHEMVYFFYEQAPKYNRDKYHKRIAGQNVCGKKKRNEPPNPASVVEEKYTKEYLDNKQKTVGTGSSEFQGIFTKENRKKFQKENGVGFEPPNPASVIEIDPWGCKNGGDKGSPYGLKYDPPNPASVLEEKTEADKDEFGWDKGVVKERGNKIGKMGGNFHPVQPASVIEEKIEEEKTCYGIDKNVAEKSGNPMGKVGAVFEPPNPASVLEEKTCYGISKEDCKNSIDESVRYNGANFHPIQPASVLEENTIVEENTIMECKEFGTGKHYGYANGEPAGAKWEPVLPVSMFESEKVFIGKRHHQTEKPQDILEFFLKYWTDEGDTILDPTMGSGSTGVACKKLNRKFIGFELDETIFNVAKKRCE